MEWSVEDRAFRDEVHAFLKAELTDDIREAGRWKSYELRAMTEAARGASPGVSGSLMKILGTELSQHLTELALEAAGQYGRIYQPQTVRPGGAVSFPHGTGLVGPREAAVAPLHYLNDRAGSIYAGSNEIQRNIIAKAALGL